MNESAHNLKASVVLTTSSGHSVSYLLDAVVTGHWPRAAARDQSAPIVRTV